MPFVISLVRDVPATRTGNATRHSLLDVLTIALVASICGCESCVEVADFAEDREELFREFLDWSNGLPSHDTFSRLLRLLDPDALSHGFGRFLDHVGADGCGVLAVDGKTLRRFFDRAAGTSPLHVVTAFAADARLVLGHRAMAAGENEIVAARALLGWLKLGRMLVTADAIHGQRDTAAAVLERGGDNLFSLKSNLTSRRDRRSGAPCGDPRRVPRAELSNGPGMTVRRAAVTTGEFRPRGLGMKAATMSRPQGSGQHRSGRRRGRNPVTPFP